MTSIDDDGIAAVVLNRPTKFNSLSLELFKGEQKYDSLFSAAT
jgi:hypothetical protein